MAYKYQIIGKSLAAICALSLLLGTLQGCSSGPDESEVATMADMEMRAMALREQRFTLANDIRFTQDTLISIDSIGPQADELKAKLAVMAVRKDSLLHLSLVLADSIKHCMDSVVSPERYSQEERAKFGEQLNAEIKRRSGGAKGI